MSMGHGDTACWLEFGRGASEGTIVTTRPHESDRPGEPITVAVREVVDPLEIVTDR
jgi:hypothetical protein